MKKWIALGAVLTLAACGGAEHEISKSDLEKALRQSPHSGSVCVPFSLDVSSDAEQAVAFLGAPEIRLLKRLPNGKRANLAAIEQMEILVDADLYDDVGVTKVGTGEDITRLLTYRLTDKGRKQFMPSPHGNLLCIGQLDVKKINYYTTPTPANGVTTTQVSFEAKIKPERWARKLLKNSPYYQGLSQVETYTATLVKTNDGWRDILSLR